MNSVSSMKDLANQLAAETSADPGPSDEQEYRDLPSDSEDDWTSHFDTIKQRMYRNLKSYCPFGNWNDFFSSEARFPSFKEM